MAQVIAVAVPKGGTGKTTTTHNLAVALVERGKRVLCVDLDPQSNLTYAVGVDTRANAHTIYAAIHAYLQTFDVTADQAIVRTEEGFDIIPSNVRLTLAESELVSGGLGPIVLQRLLEPLYDRYDMILLDCQPSLGIIVRNALVAADSVIIPTKAEAFSVESVNLMLDMIDGMHRSGLNADLQVLGIVFTQVKERTKAARDAREYTVESYSDRSPIFQTKIPEATAVPSSQAHMKSVLVYDRRGPVAQAYRALAEEIFGDG